MGRYPEATWRPLPENSTQPPVKATQVIFHTAVDAPGATSLYGYFARKDVAVESHFWVPFQGPVEQYIDTSRSADANFRANHRPDGTGAVSIETEDDGDPNNRPWTEKQMRQLVDLGAWLCIEHDIPPVVCATPSSPGLGYHSMFGAPSDWTNARGKTCPGPARIKQFPELVARIAAKVNNAPVPGAPNPEDEEMAVYHQSSVRINAKGEIVKSGGDRPIFVFYGERYRKLTGDQYQGRAYLAALAKKPIELHQTHPWQLAKFVTDFQLIEDPATKKK